MKSSLRLLFYKKLSLEISLLVLFLLLINVIIKFLIDKFDPKILNFTSSMIIINKEDILFTCLFLGGVLISIFFKKIGKSIKSLNDCVLFFSASIVVYKTYEQNSNDLITLIEKAIDIHTLALFKSLILLCSFAKFFISAMEFYLEKKIEFNKKHNTKEELISNISNEIVLLRNIKENHSKNHQNPS